MTNKANYIKVQTNAKSIKKAMKVYGIKVLRCAQNGIGLLVTVEGSIKNREKAIHFFNEYDLYQVCMIPFRAPKEDLAYEDFGNIFRMQKINE